MCHKLVREGFVVLEALVTCTIVMLTWYYITQCAVQAIVLQKQVEHTSTALIAAMTTLEKMRSGVYPLKNQTITQEGMHIIVTCEQKLYADLLHVISVKVLSEKQELVCLKTALLKK